MTATVIVPSNPADIKAIKDAIQEAQDCDLRIQAEKEQIKSIIELLYEKYELPKKYSRKLIRTYVKQSFDKDSQETEDFAELYSTIFN